MPKKLERKISIGKFYEITDIILGRGSFSTVYMARHNLFGNKIAVKVIDRNNIKEDYVSRNIQREAHILRKLKHPNIINFYEEFLHGHLYCIAMEFVEGSDLSRFLKKQDSRKLTEKFAKTLFLQMVSAINYMHKLHILHRDLKLENILLEYERIIKIVDFGLSNVYFPHTLLRTHCGSLEYAAPELFVNSSSYGAGVDVWSLGVILYSMVTGEMPFVVQKREDGTVSESHKNIFSSRISQGLKKENLKKLKHLSYDCCNLLKNLLQPNQFRRLQIRDAYAHPWLQDYTLRKSLPQHRQDLQRKYKHEIIDWMAEKLGISKKRIYIHLATYRYDTISAIYYMVQDTLVKEILYPPTDLKNSLIYRLNRRPKTRASYDPYDILLDEQYKELSQTFGKLSFLPSGQNINDGCKFIKKESRNESDNQKDVGDGDHLYHKKLTALKYNHEFVESEDRIASRKDTSLDSKLVEDQDPKLAKPFRSYKMNRPMKVKLSGDTMVKTLSGEDKVSEKTFTDHDSVDFNEHLGHSLVSSNNSNYRRNVKMLSEKYGLKSKSANETEVPQYGKSETGATNIKNCNHCEGTINKNNYKNIISRRQLFKINNTEVYRKEDFQHNSYTRPKTYDNSNHQSDQTTNRSQQKSAGKNSTIPLSNSRNRQQKQSTANSHRTDNSTNVDKPSTKLKLN